MEDGRCWFWSGKSATPVFYGEAFYGEAYKSYLQFYSKCDTLLSSIPICEAVDTFQKGIKQKQSSNPAMLEVVKSDADV